MLQIEVLGEKIISIVHEGVWTLAVFFKKKKIPYGSDVCYGFDNEKNWFICNFASDNPVIERFSRFLDNLYVSFCKMTFCALYFFFFAKLVFSYSLVKIYDILCTLKHTSKPMTALLCIYT